MEDRFLLTAFVVDTLVDSADGADGLTSLREAITAANQQNDADTITFDNALTATGPATILLTQGEIRITNPLTLQGPGPDFLTIDASGNDPTPNSTPLDDDTTDDADGSRALNIGLNGSSSLTEVTIAGLSFTGGDVNGSGGAIFSRTGLRMSDVVLFGNSAIDAGGGVRIEVTNNSAIHFVRTTIRNNTARVGGGASISLHNHSELLIDTSVISHNTSVDGGGGVRLSGSSGSNFASTVIRSSVISHNVAQAVGSQGGGISETSVGLRIENSLITSNRAGTQGGGIATSGIRQIVDSEISRNSLHGVGFDRFGGGMLIGESNSNSNERPTITRTLFSHNTAGGGGGLFLFNVRVANRPIVAESTFVGNEAESGGGIQLRGSSIDIVESTFASNRAIDGGAINGGSGRVFIAGSTLNDNSAENKGGGMFVGQLVMQQCTLSGNIAENEGGGLWLGSGGTITHSTVTANRATSAGGGLFVSNGTLVLEHSIIASNYGVGQDITGLLGAILLPRYNLIGSNDRTGLMEAPIGYPDANGNLIGGETSSRHIYPELAALADNGGPTKTHALLQNSPAVDAGDPTAVAGLSGIPEVDQRGAPFSRVANDNTSVGKRIDMGAYELQRPLACDFNRDLHCTIDDIDMLVSAIASESYNSLFDLTLDDLLDLLDRDAWLALAGAENLSSERPYLPGDANLDGFVSDMDLEIWNENKFTLAAAWSAADFNADGIVDVSDFSIWNSHKYLSSLARDVGDDLSTNLRSNSSVRTEAVELDEAAHPTSESDDDDFKVKRRLRGLRNLTLTPSSAK